jgi:signal transduction histidine kinase
MSKTKSRKVLDTFLRSLLVVEIGFVLASVVNIVNYKNYWERTIFRVQTVDFNMLSHTLPPKLSATLLQNDTQELQRTLDSNYGYFSLVVTDCKTANAACPNQKIIYASEARKNVTEPIRETDLLQKPFDLLKDPPPLLTEARFPHARAVDREATGKTNPGNIIGRVYYVRGTPPSFWGDYFSWIKNPLGEGGAKRAYTLTFILFTVGSSFIWTVADTRRFKSQARLANLQNQKLETDNKLIKEKQERLEAENQLYRLNGYFAGFKEIIEQDFSSLVANHLEELRGILRRLDTDVDNIVHDMRKATLLGSDFGKGQRIADNVSQYITEAAPVQQENVLQSVREFLIDTNETVNSIDWVLKDLREIANVQAEKISVQQAIESFISNLPPNVASKSWIKVTFRDKCETPMWITCNLWHLKSVAKNVIYNATASLIGMQIEDFDFQGEIQIVTFQRGDEAGITILDNGSGFSEDALTKLYQSPRRVNDEKSNRNGRGSVIVNSYLALHNGKVELCNRPEGGASVTFFFPLVPA